MADGQDIILDEELEQALSPKNFVTEGDCMFAKGAKIGEFEIVSRLGNSGIGELYLARSVVSRKRFAIKILPPAASAEPKFEELFLELRSKALGRIHPHIAHIQKMGCHSDDVLEYHYIVMDYIESSLGRPQTLQDLLIDNGRLSESKTLKIILQVCDALDYAHNAKAGAFIHSDLKPANILFDTANLVRVTDFDALYLLGRRFVKDTVRHCVNKAQSQDWTDLVMRQETIRMPSTKKMDSTEAHLLLDSPGKFSFKDLGISRLVKSDYIRGFMETLKGDSAKDSGKKDAKAGEKSFKRQGQRGSPTGISAIYAVLDSYDYMSPEQKAGLDLSPQSNIYSLGLIIYRMLTGRKMAGCWDLPSKFGVSKGWDNIIVKCLKMEPEERYGSIAELRDALAAVHCRRIGVGHLLATAVAIALLATFSALFWGNEIASRFTAIFSKHATIERLEGREIFPLTIKASPYGAKVEIFKNGELAGSSDSIGSEGIEIMAEAAEYSLYASLPGRPAIRHDFAADSSLREFSIAIPHPDEARTYMKRSDLALPAVGFPWDISEMKMTMLPISAGPLPNSPARTIKRPFWMSDREIWQWQYEKIMRANPSQFRDTQRQPVERTSLANATEFCKRLSEIEHQAGRLPDGYVYRLPTETEWEYCALAGSSAKPDDRKSLAKYVWYDEDSGGRPHPVASLKPNAWGLYDLQGNVWEFCANIIKRPNPDNPEQTSFAYFAKGGSWSCPPSKVSIDSRLIVPVIDKQEQEVGFRVVLAPPLDSVIIDEMPPPIPTEQQGY